MSAPQRIRYRTPAALIENVLQLVSLPQVYMRLEKVLENPLHTRDDVANVVSYDPSLSARILRIANSAYYAFPNKIDSISTAVNIIGEVDLRNIVLAVSVVNSMAKLDPVGFDIETFWWHSILCGLTAREIARKVGDDNRETLFLAGMLHDLGILIIYHHEQELANAVDWQKAQHRQNRDLAEQELLGFDHAQVGGLLATAWGLTTQLCELIHCHHSAQKAEIYPRQAQILSLANIVTHADFDVSSSAFEASPEIFELLEALDLADSDIPHLIEVANHQGLEIQSIICG